MKSDPLLAYAEAILVTILWSSSFVLIKYGLSEIPPFLFAAVRYPVAFLFLGTVFVTLRKRNNTGERMVALIGGKRFLLAAGICGYTLAQGLDFAGLFYLPAVTTSFILNFTPIFVLLLGILFLSERVSRLQLSGLAIALGGSYAFFQDKLLGSVDLLGVMIVVTSGISWAIYLIIVRRIQRVTQTESLKLTTVTMVIGTVGLLLLAAAFDEPRPISSNGLTIILWLGVVNTALAFFLWNHALRTIPAYELSVIQNAMLPEVAILAWLFLGEQPSLIMILGIVLVIIGVTVTQIHRFGRTGHQTPLGT